MHYKELINLCVNCRLKSLQAKSPKNKKKYYTQWHEIFNQLPSQYINEYEKEYLKRIRDI